MDNRRILSRDCKDKYIRRYSIWRYIYIYILKLDKLKIMFNKYFEYTMQIVVMRNSDIQEKKFQRHLEEYIYSYKYISNDKIQNSEK